MSNWTKKNCIASTSAEMLAPNEIETGLDNIPGWTVTDDGKRITRSWRVADFAEALKFFDRVGVIAEAENHHPDLHVVGYRNVTIELWTHFVDGVSVNDLIVAAKINAVPVRLNQEQ